MSDEIQQEVVTETNVVPDGGVSPELPEHVESVVPEVEVVPEETPAPEEPVNKRFTEVTRDRDEARRQAREANERLTKALEAVERLTTKPVEEVHHPVAEEDPEPEEPVFEDPEQYQRDMARYTREVTARSIRVGLKAQAAEQAQAAENARAHAQQVELQQAWAKRREQALVEMPDYVDVAEREDVPISVPMAGAIATDEHGPKIAYYLGKNPDVAERIAKLPLASQLMELGVIKANILSAKPSTTKAPPPIKPLTGGATPANKNPDEMSMEEYAAQRKGRR